MAEKSFADRLKTVTDRGTFLTLSLDYDHDRNMWRASYRNTEDTKVSVAFDERDPIAAMAAAITPLRHPKTQPVKGAKRTRRKADDII